MKATKITAKEIAEILSERIDNDCIYLTKKNGGIVLTFAEAIKTNQLEDILEFIDELTDGEFEGTFWNQFELELIGM